jgi:hypothetical protein
MTMACDLPMLSFPPVALQKGWTAGEGQPPRLLEKGSRPGHIRCMKGGVICMLMATGAVFGSVWQCFARVWLHTPLLPAPNMPYRAAAATPTWRH